MSKVLKKRVINYFVIISKVLLCCQHHTNFNWNSEKKFGTILWKNTGRKSGWYSSGKIYYRLFIEINIMEGCLEHNVAICRFLKGMRFHKKYVRVSLIDIWNANQTCKVDKRPQDRYVSHTWTSNKSKQNCTCCHKTRAEAWWRKYIELHKPWSEIMTYANDTIIISRSTASARAIHTFIQNRRPRKHVRNVTIYVSIIELVEEFLHLGFKITI
jgi:hypothetical protein